MMKNLSRYLKEARLRDFKGTVKKGNDAGYDLHIKITGTKWEWDDSVYDILQEIAENDEFKGTLHIVAPEEIGTIEVKRDGSNKIKYTTRSEKDGIIGTGFFSLHGDIEGDKLNIGFEVSNSISSLVKFR